MFRFIAAGATSLLLAGCVSSQPVGLTDLASYSSPTDPAVGTGVVRYEPVLGGYNPRTPSEASGWRGTAVEIAPLEQEPSQEGAAQ